MSENLLSPEQNKPKPTPETAVSGPAPKRRKQWALRILVALVVLLLLVAGAAILVLRSPQFHEYLRAKIVDQAERVTGGKVEIGDFHFDWTAMQASLNGFVLHGKEAPDAAPLVQIPSATLSFRILSVMNKSVDLAALHVDQPRINVIIYPDGSNNIPGAGARKDKTLWSEDLLNLKVREYDVTNGLLDYDNRKIPVNVHGEHLQVRMTFDAATPAYRGDLASDMVQLSAPHFGPASADPNAAPPEPFSGSVATDFVLERDQFSFQHLQLKTVDGTEAQFAGTLQNLRAPQGTLTVQAATPLKEVVRRFHLPLEPTGNATLNGTLQVTLGDPFDFAVNGRLSAAGLKYTDGRLTIEGARVDGDAEITRDGFALRHLTSKLLEADVTGDVRLEHWKDLHVTGELAGLTLQKAGEIVAGHSAAAGVKLPAKLAWSGVMGGMFSVDSTVGVLDAVTRANLTIVPSEGARPIQGHLDINFNQAAGTIALGSSSIETPATRVEVSGTLGRELRVRARSTDLGDVVPVIDLFKASNSTTELPLQLNNGSVTVDGTVTGSLNDPQFTGQFAANNGMVQGFAFDRFSAEISATRKEISARSVTAARGSTEVTGNATLTARAAAGNANALGDFGDAEITGQMSARNLQIPELAQELGLPANGNLVGTASAQVRIAGSVQHPQVSGALDVANPAAYGETLDRLTANVRYTPGELDITDGVGTERGSRLQFSGRYRYPAADIKSGEINFEASTDSLPSARIDHLANAPLAFASTFAGRVQAAGKMQSGAFSLTSATVDMTARALRVDNLAIGDFKIQAQTQGTTLTATAEGNVLESQVKGEGSWKLQGDEPGNATVRFTRLTAASAHTLAMIGVPLDRRSADLPVEGFVEGGATVALPLANPSAFRATVTIDNMQLNGKPDQALSLGVQPGDLIVKNTQPVVFDATMQEARLRPSQFTGRDTNLTASGTIPFRAGVGADLSIKGNVNLAILQIVEPGLLAQGNATVDVTIRGNLQDQPVINGRLSLADASFFMKDYPNGIEKVQGSILFDRHRATVERLAARTGEGTVTFTGFVEFGAAPVFRLQAAVDRVRVRYPQDVSMTFSGNLAFTGTADASSLIGTITLNRASFSPRADFGEIMAQMSQSNSGPDTNNAFLRGLQMDIKIDSAPGFQLETSLTRDLESAINLHLRGSPIRPGLQGTLSVDRGEVQVFGNKYTVDRGEIRFLNPSKIEPTFDMNLTTRAGGVTVNVSFVGTLAHLKPNYSSDPPLQTSEIFALLAVGRDPTTVSNQLAPGPASGTLGNSVVETGGSILGQALSSQVSSKFQRFFGSSHVRIDPTLTGVDNLPQARLQLDQQVSKDIKLTYITNLNRSTEQIVRVEWDISREWSAIAVRDQNGLFGIDFQYRTRF